MANQYFRIKIVFLLCCLDEVEIDMITRVSYSITPGMSDSWDVVVIGGALSGSSTALLLKRKDPTLRVLLIEKNTAFKRRVGEATVEASGYFLCRVLGLTSFLTQTQMSKNGLRFWFANKAAENLGDCSEIGGKYLSTVPSFLVDRSVLDEEVLSRAIAAGVEVMRPGLVKKVDLSDGGEQTIHVESEEGEKCIRARWVVDASGVRCLLARQNGWIRPNDDHPTVVGWSRWRNCGDWDGEEFSRNNPSFSRPYVGIRGTATNHVVGDGWWAWFITLKGGDTSIGLVIDQRLASWPGGNVPLEEKIRGFLSSHPAAKEIMKNAAMVSGDVNFRRNLPYSSTRQSGNGFVLTGDALAFIDPFYSPGMDWIAFSSIAAVRMIMQWREGKEMPPLIEKNNDEFAKSYRRMYEALYRNKYDYMGDYDLMGLAFRLDISFYYLFIAGTVFQGGEEGFFEPPFSSFKAVPIFALMRFYNARFAAVGRKRRELGTFGKNNSGKRDLFPGFNFNKIHLFKIVVRTIVGWAILELTEGWRSWFQGCRPSEDAVLEKDLGVAGLAA
jgi:flavin-dependent dehydrogenase